MDCTDIKPERELFIRWIQLNAFLPMMQFSFTPWQYDEHVVAIARKYVTLHADYVAPRISAHGHEAMETGYPIIRPMWWAAPDDHVTHTIGSQFMVGGDLVVAPILEKGATQRDVYLTKGIWKDMITGKEYTVDKNGYFLKAYPVKLEEIAYFERVLVPWVVDIAGAVGFESDIDIMICDIDLESIIQCVNLIALRLMVLVGGSDSIIWHWI